MHQTCQSGWEKCEKFKTVILKSYLHWYLHSICTWIFDTNFSKNLNVDTEAHATTPEPCSGRRRECSQSLSKSQRSGCLCSAQDRASLTPQAYNLTGPFSPLPLCNISDTTNIHLHMVFPASPTRHSRHATLTAEPVHIHTHHHTTPNVARPLILETNVSTSPSSLRKLPERRGAHSNELCHSSAFRSEYYRKYNSTCLKTWK